MRKKVVVVGGGYGGIKVAKELDTEAEVVLIDPKDSFVHNAAALRALVQPDWADNIFFRYDTLLKNGTVLRDRAVGVDPAGVTLASGGRVDADFVVLATGSEYAFPAKMHIDAADGALDALRATHKELAGAEHVLILGAGPVGLELSGEIKAVWPDKRVTIVDPAAEVLPGFLPEVRAELHRQLEEIGVELRLGTALADGEPPIPPGRGGEFTVATSAGDEITADIWFRAYGSRVASDYAADLAPRNERGQVPVTERLTVAGHDNVYAVGDLTDVDEAKMAAFAGRHADVVVQNIAAQLKGEEPTATYHPMPVKVVLLPLGPSAGVGQFPNEQGTPFPLPTEQVVAIKGATMMIDHYKGLFA